MALATTSIGLFGAAALGSMMGATVAKEETPAPADAELCYNKDACSDQTACVKKGTVWEIVAPARKKLWQSGPQTMVQCLRVQYDEEGCPPGEGRVENYYNPSCSEPMPPGGGG